MILFQRAFHLAHYIFPEGGACLEFGVYKGTTYCYQAEYILKQYQSSSLIGFDSWQGLPPEANGVWAPDRHAAGQYCAAKAEVIDKLTELGVSVDDKRFVFVDGFFSESLTNEAREQIKDVIFINIDVDIYKSTIELLDFVRPLLRPGVVLYWDDWKDPHDSHQENWGEHLAWENWIKTQPELKVETIEINSVNQRIMIITEVDGLQLTKPLPRISDIRYFALELSYYNTIEELEENKKEIPLIDRLKEAEEKYNCLINGPDYQLYLKVARFIAKIPLAKPIVNLLKKKIRLFN